MAITTVVSTSAATTMTAFAANYSTNYSSYNEPESNDFAYWNGSKVVKGSGTTKDEIKWMQASLNYCIVNKGLNASKLDVDGSFGPASKKACSAFQKKYGLSQDGSFGPGTISKMKSVLSNPTPNPTPVPLGKITTSQIQAVLDRYGYKTGKYWTVLSSSTYPGYSLCAKSSSGSNYMATTHPAGTKSGSKTYMSYNYGNQWQCMGFAHFVMTQVTGSNPKNYSSNKWKKLTSVSSLKVGDIIRSKSGHSSIVLSVDSNGNCTFAECWGSAKCKLSIGKGFNGSYTTLSSIKSKYGISYIYRYEG